MTPQKLFYIMLGLIGFVVVGGGAAFYFGHNQLADKTNQLERLRAESIVAQEELERLQQLEGAYDDLEELEDKTGRILPEDKLQSEVASQIFAMIDGAGLDGGGISFQSTSGIPDRTTQTDQGTLDEVLVMPVSFRVSGTYQELLLFLDNVEMQERFMQVTSLNINRSGDDDASGQLSLNIQLEVFLKS